VITARQWSAIAARPRGVSNRRSNIANMTDDERVWAVRQLIVDYVKSPSLRHIRDPHSIVRLAQDIVRRLDRGNSAWKKWDAQRELFLKSSIGCWIPVEDVRDFLNQMPGPRLTITDVSQRLRAFEDEQFYNYPNEELQPGCLALYAKEKAEGTELPAIIGLLREHVEREEDRLKAEQRQQYDEAREQDRIKRERRLLSGADCGWTQLQKSPHWYCRANGRTYRCSLAKDKRWNLYRVQAVADDEKGGLIGSYRGRRDATKVIMEMAYKPEPQW